MDTHGRKQKRALILASPRTGSSYLSALLASYPNTTLIYEPLFALSETPAAISERDVGLSLMDELFNCDGDALKFVSKYPLITKMKSITETCSGRDKLVIKTIRLRMKFALAWLRMRPDIQVRHRSKGTASYHGHLCFPSSHMITVTSSIIHKRETFQNHRCKSLKIHCRMSLAQMNSFGLI